MIAPLVALYPRAEVLHTTQNRQREKAWLKSNGFPHVAYAEALDGDIAPAVAQVGLPCVVKTADFGYDGKGQMKLSTAADLEQAVAIFRGRRCVVEAWCEFSCELSVIVARSTRFAAGCVIQMMLPTIDSSCVALLAAGSGEICTRPGWW